MALNGEEQRIRALFRELRREDNRPAPLFACEWARAQSRASQPGKRFGLLQVAAVLVVICLAVLTTVFVSRQKRQRNVAKQMVTSPIIERQPLSKSEVVVQKVVPGEPPKPQKRSPVRRRLTRESPKSHLVFTIPRLDQSSREFRSFLPARLN